MTGHVDKQRQGKQAGAGLGPGRSVHGESVAATASLAAGKGSLKSFTAEHAESAEKSEERTAKDAKEILATN